MCLRAARRHTRRPEDAEDAAQEAALRAWRGRGGLRDGLRREEWLGRIARNEALRLHERRGREVPEEAVIDRGVIDARLVEVVEGDAVKRAVALLSSPDRELLGLRYEDDLTQGAIAKRLGVPEGTIKVRLHRARVKLRHALADQ